MTDGLTSEEIDFNSIDPRTAEILIMHPFSFTPIMNIKGMTFDKELEFFEAYNKYKVDTTDVKVVVYRSLLRGKVNSSEYDIIEHYNQILSQYGITYPPEYASTTVDKHILFSNLSKFKLID